MKLAAYMVVHNELDRYLIPCLEQLSTFCDEIAIWDDGSTDGTEEALKDLRGETPPVRFHRSEEREFFNHEGRLRTQALRWCLEWRPTHVIAVDADELILEGAKLREAMAHGDAWSLCMREVWKAKPKSLEIRQDGGWCEHAATIGWKNKANLNRISDVKLACGRVPAGVGTLRPRYTDVAIYHFGWANKEERAARHERYAVHDGGRYHRGSHIASIMYPDMDIVSTTETVKVPKPWVDRANRSVVESDPVVPPSSHVTRTRVKRP